MSVTSADAMAKLSTHTQREIMHQPTMWARVRDSVGAQEAAIHTFLSETVPPNARIILTGAGTSAFIGEILQPALSTLLERRVDALATTDIVSNPRPAFAEDIPTLLVSFARSGNSPESVAATGLANATLSRVNHLVITCDSEGHLYREHTGVSGSLALLTPAGTNDKSFAMTSSFSSLLLTALLAFIPSYESEIDRIARSATWSLTTGASVLDDLAGHPYHRVVYLGSGSLAGLARESALKLLELTAGNVVGLYDSSLGFRHGPKSVLDQRTLAVVFVSNDPYTRQYDLDILTELGSTPGDHDVLAVSTQAESIDGVTTHTLPELATVPDELLALPYVTVAQQIALRQSFRWGIMPDNPFPTGSVNRVVKGVTIHSFRSRVHP